MIREIFDSQQWNHFLLQQNPNTFLQSWEWGQVQQKSGHTPHSLGIFDNNSQVGAALALEVPARRGPHWLIPHGPIFKTEEQARKYLLELVEYLKNTPEVSRSDSSGVARRGSSPVALRIAPLLKNIPENQKTFSQLGFRPAPMHVHAELTWVLDINKLEEELLAGMRKTTRHAIQKSPHVGVSVEITTDPAALARFLPLYEQTKHRHDFIPYSPQLIESQFKTFTQSQSPNVGAYLTIARYQNKDVAAGIFFRFGTTVFYYHGASVKTSSRVSPAQLLQWESIREAKRRGATRFNFWGIAPNSTYEVEPGVTPRRWLSVRSHPFAGITTFKRGFGGYAIDYMHAQDLPLSAGYWKLWLVEHFRRIRRGF